MLDEYKQIYRDCADLIPNWKKLNKNELANLYIDHENDPSANSYFSALILKFWNLIGHFYYKQEIKFAAEEDCYNWLITGITFALNKRVWKDPNNKLYEDEKGPEKAIMTCIMSDRANYYQYTRYDKRNLNYNSLSLENLEENSSDGFFIPYTDNYITLTTYVLDKVKEAFANNNFFYGFFIDALFNYDIVIKDKHTSDYIISLNKFKKYITHIDTTFLKDFSNLYNIAFDIVMKGYKVIGTLPSYQIHAKTNQILNNLKKDDLLFSLLKGDIL